MAQRAEEARRQLQAQMEEQVKQVEQASEEERRSLQQELSRVKQEVVTIMKVSCGISEWRSYWTVLPKFRSSDTSAVEFKKKLHHLF